MSHPADAALVRSWLFCPATAPDRFEKAARSGADAVIVDLEDAVAPGDKDAARAGALPWLRATATDGVVRCLRSNGLRTAAGLRDVLALLETGTTPDFLVLPKVESAAEIAIAAEVLGGACASIRFLPLVETARGIGAAEAIASAPRVAGLVLGGADLAADLGAELAWEPLLWSRARLVQAAAAHAVAAIDVPHLVLDDDAGLADESARVRRLGFTGKLAIHPRQVGAINVEWTPSDAEVERARRIVAAVAKAAGGVAVVDGKMVDAPVVRSAERTLARAAVSSTARPR
jgi:citrate lyase beta subunit